jgi:hypothetical protein
MLPEFLLTIPNVVVNLLAAWIRNFGIVDAIGGLRELHELGDVDAVEDERNKSLSQLKKKDIFNTWGQSYQYL